MVRVLIATPEPVARRLAGPAIRAAQIARVLSGEHDVTLVSLAGESKSPIDGRTVRGPEAITGDFDAVIVQGRVLIEHPELARSNTPMVIDWFDPFHVEALHRGGSDRIRTIDLVEGARSTLFDQAQRGDFFICSNAIQREHWLGWLAAAGRLNPQTHDDDPLFESLIAIAPFGVESRGPGDHKPIQRTFSVVGPHDPVVLWAGGLHDWLDPLLPIRAMPTVLEENPDARLVYLAGPHPNTSIEHMGVRGEAISLAKDMKLFAKHVLFANEWIDYGDRLAWFENATLGVVADRDHLESRYSHRTRLLDHLAVGLPTVSTSGDPLSTELVAHGAAVGTSRNAGEMGRAIASVINNDAQLTQMSKAATELARGLSWESTLAPLVNWLSNPQQALDRRGRPVSLVKSESALSLMAARARMHLDDGGVKQVVQRGVRAGRNRFNK